MYAAGVSSFGKLRDATSRAAARARDVHGVQRAERVREARGEVVGQLAPQRIVPAELAAARDVDSGSSASRYSRTPSIDFTALRHVASRDGRRRSAARRARGPLR